MLQVTGMDHIVLNVADVERSAAWYRDKLGLDLIRMDEWRAGEVLFPSLRIDATTLVDLFQSEATGHNLNHVALVVDTDDLQAVIDSGVFELAGPDHPSDLFGAQGQGLGIYVKDPDGNTVELRTYRQRPGSHEDVVCRDATFGDIRWTACNPSPRSDVATVLANDDGTDIGVGSVSADTQTLVFRVKRNEPF